MKPSLIRLAQQYESGLARHLRQRNGAGLPEALALGRQALGLRLETLDLARIHEQGILNLGLTNARLALSRRAQHFFTAAITPIVDTHRAARENRGALNRLKETLNRRTLELAATNRLLKRGIGRRKSVEAAFKKSGVHYDRLLKDSLQLQEGLRRLTHQVLAAQEEERKKISRELQDEVVQTLVGVNVRLLSLKQESQGNTRGIKREIASTRRLVAESARSVRRAVGKFGKT